MTSSIESSPISMLDRIKCAKSKEELLSLETESSGYEYAKNQTRNRWRKASMARRAQLLRDKKK